MCCRHHSHVHVSRNGSLPTRSDSIMNLMFGSMSLMCAVNFSMLYSWICTNVSSTYLHQTDGGLVSMYKLATMSETRDLMAATSFCL